MELTDLPTLNASLNAAAATLLVVGFALIKRGRESAHKRCMVAAFGCSVAFLSSYIYYHANAGRISFTGEGLARTAYFAVLLTHTLLAALVPPLALRTLWLGFKDQRVKHRWWARLTFPIWLYVSVTGVLIYFALYHWTDSAALALVENTR